MSRIHVAVCVSAQDPEPWQRQCIARLLEVCEAEVTVAAGGAPVPSGADVVLELTERPILSENVAPRLGYWRFVFGTEGRLADPGLREHLTGDPTAMARLIALPGPARASDRSCEQDAAIVVESGVLKTIPHSFAATRARILDAIASWPARIILRILESPADPLRGPHISLPADSGVSWWSRALVPLASARNLVTRVVRELEEDHWAIGVIPKPVEHVVDSFDARAIRWLPVAPGECLADPFVVTTDEGRATVLAEAYSFDDRQGRIVALDLDRGRMAHPPREVLRLAGHLSYPHVIAHGGGIYCLPEASSLRRVQLFRALSFPDKWVPDRVLLPGFPGVDTTLVQHDGRWWMFTTDRANQDQTQLHIFHAPDLFGPWSPHAANPVKCDLRSARPAGPLFWRDGELFRPSQDCSRVYGGAIAINRVLALSPRTFAEETVSMLRPDPAGARPHGLHTVAGAGDITLVDGKQQSRSLARLVWGAEHFLRGVKRQRQETSRAT